MRLPLKSALFSCTRMRWCLALMISSAVSFMLCAAGVASAAGSAGLRSDAGLRGRGFAFGAQSWPQGADRQTLWTAPVASELDFCELRSTPARIYRGRRCAAPAPAPAPATAPHRTHACTDRQPLSLGRSSCRRRNTPPDYYCWLCVAHHPPRGFAHPPGGVLRCQGRAR